MAHRRAEAILLIEGARGAFGELEGRSIDCHEEIAGASRDHLASKAIALTSHEWRPLTLVADVTAVAAAGVGGFIGDVTHHPIPSLSEFAECIFQPLPDGFWIVWLGKDKGCSLFGVRALTHYKRFSRQGWNPV
jgi:hypothetical protein